MIAEYGRCMVCAKDLMQTCPTCNVKKPGANYTEVQLKLSNGSLMPVASCLTCKDNVFTADRKALMAAVRQGWAREHDKMNWDSEKRAAYWAVHGEGILEIVDA